MKDNRGTLQNPRAAQCSRAQYVPLSASEKKQLDELREAKIKELQGDGKEEA